MTTGQPLEWWALPCQTLRLSGCIGLGQQNAVHGAFGKETKGGRESPGNESFVMFGEVNVTRLSHTSQWLEHRTIGSSIVMFIASTNRNGFDRSQGYPNSRGKAYTFNFKFMTVINYKE